MGCFRGILGVLWGVMLVFWGVVGVILGYYGGVFNAESDKTKTFQIARFFIFWIKSIYWDIFYFGQFLDLLDSLWIFWTVSKLSGQSLDCPDSF